MRVISWNMGCAYGSLYKRAQARTWQQLLAWGPDIALVQETTDPSAWLPLGSYVFTPYGWSAGKTVEIGTLVYARSGEITTPQMPERLEELIPGQVTLASVATDSTNLLVASIHAATTAVDPTRLVDLADAGVGGSHTGDISPLDLILHELKALTPGRRFIIGGDLNASVRFDDLYTKGSALYGNVEWFTKAREAGWWNAHRKFHTGDQRTLFRPGKDEPFQIDHLFTDRATWASLTACDVLTVPYLGEFTDHAPMVLETAGLDAG